MHGLEAGDRGHGVLSIAEVRVPRQHASCLEALAKLPVTAFDALLAVASSLEAIPSRGRMGARIGEDVPELSEIGWEAFFTVVSSLHGLHSSHAWPHSEIVEAVSRATVVDLEDAKRALLTTRLTQLLEAPGLAILARAADVATQQDNVFHTARCFTDVRPIFIDDEPTEAAGAIISQTLKIDFFGSDGRLDSFYVALTRSELSRLRQVIDRAEQKAQVSERLLESAGLAQIDMDEEDLNG